MFGDLGEAAPVGVGDDDVADAEDKARAPAVLIEQAIDGAGEVVFLSAVGAEEGREDSLVEVLLHSQAEPVSTSGVTKSQNSHELEW